MGLTEMELEVAAREARLEHEKLITELPKELNDLAAMLPKLDITQCRTIKALIEEIKQTEARREKDRDRIDL